MEPNFKTYSNIINSDYVMLTGEGFIEVVFKRISVDGFRAAYAKEWEAGVWVWNSLAKDTRQTVNSDYLIIASQSRGSKPKLMTKEEFERFYFTEIY